MNDSYFFVSRPAVSGGGGGGGAHTGETGRVRRQQLAFLREDGSTFPFRGADSFSLYHRFLLGEDILPVLLELVALGFSVIRVFAMYNEIGIGKANGLGRLHPGLPNYWERWPAFLRLCATVGMRVETVLLADTVDVVDHGVVLSPGIIPNTGDQQSHVNRLYDLLEAEWNANWCETCNEPGKNGVNLSVVVPRQGQVLRASGNYDLENGRIAHVLDYVTTHTERKFEWPRTCRALSEIRDGADGLEATHCPVVSDEPTGFAEQARPDSRSGPGYFADDGQVTDHNKDGWSYLDDARQYAAGCQMHGAGSTYHYDDGVASRLMGPAQKLAAQAWIAGAIWMPVEAQFAPYQRGGAGGGPGIGDMPINHHDLEEATEPRALRTYAKRAQGLEFCNAIRKGGGWFPEMLRGCSLVEQTFPGLTKVREP